MIVIVTDDSYCDRFHSSLIGNHCFVDGSGRKRASSLGRIPCIVLTGKRNYRQT